MAEKRAVKWTPSTHRYEKFRIDPRGHIEGLDKRDIVREQDFELASTPKHSEESIAFVAFYANVIGQKIKVSKKKSILLRSNNMGRYYDAFSEDRRIKDQFIITVGVIDPDLGHVCVDGREEQTYEKLFERLKNFGYDPLAPIRNPEFKDKTEKKMGAIVMKMLNSTRIYGTGDIKSKLLALGREIRDYCRDYIRGGDKPPLADRTLEVREWKSKKYDFARYPNGIEEPLSETGQLERAITVDVEATYSQGRKDFYKERREALEKAKAKIRARNKKVTTDQFGRTEQDIRDEIERLQDAFGRVADEVYSGQRPNDAAFRAYARNSTAQIHGLQTSLSRLFGKKLPLFNKDKFLASHGRLEQ